MSIREQTGFQLLLNEVARQLEGAEKPLTSRSREALALSIVQSVASFVLEWNEGTGTLPA